MKNKNDLLVDFLSIIWKGGVAVYETLAGSPESGKTARANAQRELETKHAEWQKTKIEFEKLKQERERNK